LSEKKLKVKSQKNRSLIFFGHFTPLSGQIAALDLTFSPHNPPKNKSQLFSEQLKSPRQQSPAIPLPVFTRDHATTQQHTRPNATTQIQQGCADDCFE
jgi:tRNA A37 methylthiotransferase MiaB